MNFFKTNTFIFNNKKNRYFQMVPSIVETTENADKSFDFFGLNFYANTVITPFGTTCFPHQIMGDMNLPIDPEGFEEAIKECSLFGKPIIITENGFADNTDTKRPHQISCYIDVLKKLLKASYNIKGYYHWTLIDNFEWHQGRTKKFGLCDELRNPKQSYYYYQNIIKKAQLVSVQN